MACNLHIGQKIDKPLIHTDNTWNSSLRCDELVCESILIMSKYAALNSQTGMAVSPHKHASSMASWIKIYCSCRKQAGYKDRHQCIEQSINISMS